MRISSPSRAGPATTIRRPGISRCRTAKTSSVDGASQVLVDIFGEAGRHVRTNVGVAWLPLGSPVETSLVVALAEGSR